MLFSKLAQECLTHLAAYKGYSPNTIDQYAVTAKQFGAYLQHRSLVDDLRFFTEEHVLGYCHWIAEKGVGPNTIRHRLTGLRAIASFGMKTRDGKGKPRVPGDPTATFDWPQLQQPETRFLYPDELRALLAVEVEPYLALARTMLVETGLRVSELARATVGDLLEGPRGVVLSVTVKGRGRREQKVHTPLSDALARRLQDWLLSRNVPDPGEPLLISSTGAAWTRAGLASAILRMAQRAGIARVPVRPHVLRHTANVVARGAKLDPFVRARLLHHTNTSSLARYDHLIPDELHDARARTVEGLRQYLGDDASMVRLYGTAPEAPPVTPREHDAQP